MGLVADQIRHLVVQARSRDAGRSAHAAGTRTRAREDDELVYVIFWLILGLMFLAVVGLLFAALRPGRVKSSEEVTEAELADRRRRASEFWRNESAAQSHGQRDKEQVTEPDEPEGAGGQP